MERGAKDNENRAYGFYKKTNKNRTDTVRFFYEKRYFCEVVN